jgi:hypothetical protein
MPLSWNEIKNRALRFSKEWADTSNEEVYAKPFLVEFESDRSFSFSFNSFIAWLTIVLVTSIPFGGFPFLRNRSFTLAIFTILFF